MWDAKAIHTRLAARQASDPDCTRFGARRHRHQLGPVLTEADVTRFEAEHGIVLPDTYRAFLLEVGNGGAGPDYGLFPLDGTGMRSDDRAERSWPGYLATTFPHTQPWNPPYYVPPPDRPAPVGRMTEAEYFDPRWTSGSLIIAEYGCGSFHRLVITGPAR
ncbi:MAG: SMI1/KNR4 family protein, partial [Hamadaea sp.]|nr:SMI1/KNR4 family protein [Hamadaea sp.]